MMPCPHCGALRPAVSAPCEGETCATCGRSLVVCGFRVGAVLGRGSSGAVFAATHVMHGEAAAVKVRSLADPGSWRAHERFEKSARILRTIEHPGLPRVYGFEPMGTGGRAFLVLERLSARTLHERIARQRARLDDATIRALLRALLEPLAVLHARGLVHRDVSPHNVMFRDDGYGQPVLVDCDALAEERDDDVTTFVGTPGFVAPEQIAGAATCASDVYAAAATVLFAASRGDLSRELRAILASMMASDPNARPRNAREALARLDAPSPPKPRPKLATVATIAMAVTFIGAVPWQHANARVEVDEASPLACRIITHPAGAAVFAADPNLAWGEDRPLEEMLGRTPLVVSRATARSIVLHKSGYRPYVLSLGEAQDGQPSCSFVARLTAE